MSTTSTIDPSDLINSKDACRLLDVDKSTLTRWVQKGHLTPVMRVGSSPNAAMLFSRDDIAEIAAILAEGDE